MPCNLVDVKATFLQGDKIERDAFEEFDLGFLWELKHTVSEVSVASRP